MGHEQPISLSADDSPSLRVVSGVEVVSVMTSVLIITWGLIPLLPRQRWVSAIPALLALALIINSQRARGETPAELGLTTKHFGRAVKLLFLPALLATAIFLWIGWSNDSFHRYGNFWAALALLPLSGVVQQYFLQGFVYRRVRFMLGEGTARASAAVALTAVLFSLAHAPNVSLMVMTFIGGLIWSWVYERAPNLFALGLSHGLMSLLAISTLPPWLLHSLSVGYKHFLYQKF